MDPVPTVLAREFPDREPQTVEPVPRGNRKRTVLVDFADDMAEIDPEFSVEEATDGAVGATPPSHE
jgi:hypothetical protein